MASGDDRYSPSLPKAADELDIPSHRAVQEELRKVWENLASLEGRSGAVLLRDKLGVGNPSSVADLATLDVNGVAFGTSPVGLWTQTSTFAGPTTFAWDTEVLKPPSEFFALASDTVYVRFSQTGLYLVAAQLTITLATGGTGRTRLIHVDELGTATVIGGFRFTGGAAGDTVCMPVTRIVNITAAGQTIYCDSNDATDMFGNSVFGTMLNVAFLGRR